AWSNLASASLSPLRMAANGSLSFHSGCLGARSLTRSREKATWTYIGCSHQRDPSLSKVATRLAAGPNSAPPSLVTRVTKSRIAFCAGVSFHDGSGSPSAASAPVRGARPGPRAARRARAGTASHRAGRENRIVGLLGGKAGTESNGLMTLLDSFHRLCLRELPAPVEDLLPRAVEAHQVVPARRDRQAVGRRAVAAAELDHDRAVRLLLGRQVVESVGVLLVRLEVALRVVYADRPQAVRL